MSHRNSLGELFVYPITILADRYGGAYSQAPWTAWHLPPEHIPADAQGGDTDCASFWERHRKGGSFTKKVRVSIESLCFPELAPWDYAIGLGKTPDEAEADLRAKIEAKEDGAKKIVVRAIPVKSTHELEDRFMSMTEVEIARLQNDVAALTARVDTLEKVLLLKLHELCGTCDAEDDNALLGHLTCTLVKGHTGLHESKGGTGWGPTSSGTVGQPLPTRTQPGEVEANIARNIRAAYATLLGDVLERFERPREIAEHGYLVISAIEAKDWAERIRKVIGHPSSATVSDPEAGPRDRFNALAEKLVTGLVTYEAVRQALKDVFYEGRREGELAAKETWGEAIEETDKQRAFRVAETLFGDRLISGDRKAVEQRFVEALAESRALGMLQAIRKAIPYTADHEQPFFDELERHRKNVDAARNAGHGNSEQHWIGLTDAVWFLLALAHQPGPGVVEIGGSSPSHQYEEINGSTGQATRIAFKGWSAERRRTYIEGLIDEHAYALGFEGTSVMGTFDSAPEISRCWAEGKRDREKKSK